MNEAETLAAIGRGLADRSRAAMCLALLDGEPWTVSALAAEAGIRLPTASEHVARLAGCGLVTTSSPGRHKYVRLAGPRVAEVLETLGGLALAEPARPQSLSAVRRDATPRRGAHLLRPSRGAARCRRPRRAAGRR